MEYVRIVPVTEEFNLVLASNSPRRRDLLALGDWQFSVRPANVDESLLPGETPGAYVIRLALHKAETCAATLPAHVTVIAADTTVAIDDHILGKPRDPAEAVAMLRRLRGRRHAVHTGIAVHKDADVVSDLCSTAVPMRAYTDEEIEAYVASGDALDKAGAYAIQHPGFHPVEDFTGCFASVMGLPLCHLARSLEKISSHPLKELPARCQASLHYRCPISAAVLRGEAIG